ncbi:MAG: hypothetical protein E6I35_06370 [Chloroflexi bacterium]|nr:MAG: hypothetical protein E6I35_06370 [Chloroflexota bacterium]
MLALALLCLLALGLWWTWRRPFVGLGLLVAGFAFHSFLLMVLLRLGTPAVLVRAFQGWKEILIAALTVIVLMRIWRELRTGRSGLLLFTDWIAIGLAVITIVYFLLPESILHSGTNFAQRLVGFRVIALIPLIYFLARRLEPAGEADLQTVLWLAMGAGAIVSLFGVFELFFVPTRTWIDWGVNQYTQILGFKYNGPGGMPPNFFVTLPDGTLLRRVVSTYISPLGVAYTGLLLFPLGVVLIDHQRARSSAKWLAIAALTLVLIGVMFAVTRLALFALVGEAGLMWLLLRRGWIAALVPVLVVASVLMLYPYASLGPAVDRNLNEVKRTQWQWAISGNDSSAQEHYGFLIADLKFDLQHPFGLGTGASTARYGQLVGTGESAVLGMFGDLGIIGGLLYVAFYLLALWNGWRAYRAAPKDSLVVALPLTALVGGLALLPVTVTSDVWGDLSVTYLLWWAAGASATLAARRSASPVVARASVRTSPVTPLA